jgi:hypothetical protein
MSKFKVFVQGRRVKIKIKNKDMLNDFNSDDFNKFRRLNELPLLYQKFKEVLPSFEEWLRLYDLKYRENFLHAPHTGQLFFGENQYEFVRFWKKNKIKSYIGKDFPRNDKHLQIISVKRFIPYLGWAKKNLVRISQRKLKI